MNTRLSQDAAETMAWFEAQLGPLTPREIAEIKAHRATVLARWDAAQPPKIVGTWSPTITEQERAERERQIAAGEIEF